MNEKSGFLGKPFYIFISVLITVISVTVMQQQAAQGATVIQVASVGILSGLHILMYWLNARFHGAQKWFFFYHLIQTTIVVAISLFPMGLHIIGTFLICLIGEAIGTHGNNRRALWIGILYGVLGLLRYVVFSPESSLLTFIPLLINGGFIIIVMVLFNQQLTAREKSERLLAQLEGVNLQLERYAAQIEALTLQAERERMARELHDTLVQGTAGLVLQLEAIKAHHERKHDGRVQNLLEQALKRARSTLAESRAAIEDLRNDSELPFVEAVQQIVTQFEGQITAAITLDCQIVEEAIPAHIQHHARRSLHELLSNVSKHAAAKTVQVTFLQDAHSLKLTVADDGQGFDPSSPVADGHFGLQGLEERARLTESVLSVDSQIGKGTTVSMTFPLKEQA